MLDGFKGGCSQRLTKKKKTHVFSLSSCATEPHRCILFVSLYFCCEKKEKRKSAAVCLSRECRNNPAADSFHWKHYLLKKKKSIKLVLVFQTNQEIVNVSFPRFEHYGPNSIQTATVLMSLRPAAVPPADVIFQSGPILVTVFLKKS